MITKPMSLTIVVPTLNARKTIRATLESVAPLREIGAKIILSDSYSEDDTPTFCQGLFDELVLTPKGNMYAAINAGISRAESEWVSYLNADDLIYSDQVIRAFETLEPNSELIYGDIDFIDFFGRFLHSFRLPEPAAIIPLASSLITAVSPIGSIYTKKLWEKLNGFNTDYRFSADFDFFLRAALSGAKIYKSKGPTIGAFRLHGKQLSQGKDRPCLLEAIEIIKNLQPKASKLAKITALINFKAANVCEFIIRLLRRKSLTGSGFSGCTTLPDYQKD